MRLDRFNVPADVKRLLSHATLVDVVAQFHPDGECYVCHRPLGTTGRFSLRVAENGPVAVAVPSHAPCHASSAASVAALGLPEGTYRTLPVGIPIESGGRHVLMPVLLVNPSIDVVTLIRAADGRLRDTREDTMLGMHWGVYTPDVPIHGRLEPVGSATAPPHPGGDWTVATALGTWVVDLPPEVAHAVTTQGSLFVMVLYRTPVTDFFAAPDPLAAILAGIRDEPAMFGRCEHQP